MINKKHALILLLNYLFFDSPRQITYLADIFTSIDDFKANFKALSLENLKKKSDLSFYLARLEKFDLEKYLADLTANEISLLFFDDANYPNSLREISDAPQVIFYQGKAELLKTSIIGMVGSRDCSTYGEQVTNFFAQNLSRCFTICSGLARGLDAVAHQTVLEKGGHTIGVIASGLDNISPKSNQSIFERMRIKGVIISEYPLGTVAEGFRFHQRNRLIAALSKGVLVTEANERSGTLITARCALEYGRDVFVVPSSIFDSYNFGGLKLVQVGGAKLAYKVEDILDEYNFKVEAIENQPKKEEKTKAEQLNLFLTKNPVSEGAEKILKMLQEEGSLNMDQLAIKTGEPLTVLLNSITELELLDAIKSLPGNKYQLV